MLSRRAFVAGAAAGLVAAPAFVRAQQRRVARIAILSSNPAGDYRHVAFLEGLRDFGYTEGKDIVNEYFLAPTDADLPEWAAKAVASMPDLIVAFSTLPTVAAKAITTTIPIVFANVGTVVELGIVASIPRPGGNVTGTTGFGTELVAKELQLLSQFVPGLARVAVLYSSEQLQAQLSLDELFRAGRILNIDVRRVGVKAAADIAPAIASAVSEGAQGIFLLGAPIFGTNLQLVTDEVRKHRLPSIADNRTHPAAGGLMSYGQLGGPSYNFRRAAYFVDRILKGAKPADLPVEFPREFELVINKRTADALGLEIPLGLLVQATEVIE